MDDKFDKVMGVAVILAISSAVLAIGTVSFFAISDALQCKEQTGFYKCETPEKNTKGHEVKVK